MFIRCPTCGDRASVYHCGGDRYKFSCGFCGDEGFLRISNWEEPKTAYERVEEKFQSLDEHLRPGRLVDLIEQGACFLENRGKNFLTGCWSIA